jgi:hypothetical protein
LKIDPSLGIGVIIGGLISTAGVLWGVYVKRSSDITIHSQDQEDKSAERTDRQLNAALKRAGDCEERERDSAKDRAASERLISSIEGEVTVISGRLEDLSIVQDPLCPGSVLALRYIGVIKAGCARIQSRLNEQRGALVKEEKNAESEARK